MYGCGSRDKTNDLRDQITSLNNAILDLTTAVGDITRRLDCVEQQQSSQQMSIKEVMEECTRHKGMKPAELGKDMETQLQKLQTWVDRIHEQQTQAEQDRLQSKKTALSALSVMRRSVAQITCSRDHVEFKEGNLKSDGHIQGGPATALEFFKLTDLQSSLKYHADSHNSAPLRNDSKKETGTFIQNF